MVEEQYFAESKSSFENSQRQSAQPAQNAQAMQAAAPAPAAPQNMGADGFYPIDESIEDDDLPF